MRTNTIVACSLVVVLACGAGLVYACHYPPPIDIDVWGRDGALSGTVEVVATVPESLKVERVDFFVDGELIGTATKSPFSIQWDTTTVPDGKHELHALGFTVDGKVVKSNVLVVVVDNGQDTEPDG